MLTDHTVASDPVSGGGSLGMSSLHVRGCSDFAGDDVKAEKKGVEAGASVKQCSQIQTSSPSDSASEENGFSFFFLSF